MTSQRWQIIKHDLKKIGVGLGIALLGALATYLEEKIPGIDFGQFQLLAAAVNSMVVNFIRKWVSTIEY